VHQRVDRDALAAGTADRLLQQLRVECDQVVDALPLEPFDVTVDLIVTPTRTIEVPTLSTAAGSYPVAPTAGREARSDPAGEGTEA